MTAVAGKSWRKWQAALARWSIATVLAWGGLYFANGIIDGKPYLSRGSHVFLMGRLIDTGMLANHSWVGAPASTPAAADVLTRLDYLVDRANYGRLKPVRP